MINIRLFVYLLFFLTTRITETFHRTYITIYIVYTAYTVITVYEYNGE